MKTLKLNSVSELQSNSIYVITSNAYRYNEDTYLLITGSNYITSLKDHENMEDRGVTSILQILDDEKTTAQILFEIVKLCKEYRFHSQSLKNYHPDKSLFESCFWFKKYAKKRTEKYTLKMRVKFYEEQKTRNLSQHYGYTQNKIEAFQKLAELGIPARLAYQF